MRVLILLDSFQEDELGISVLRLMQRLAPMREVTVQAVSFGADGMLSERLREVSIGTRLIPWTGLRQAKSLQQLGHKLFARADRPDVLLSFCRWPAMPARFLQAGDKRIPLACVVSSLTSGQPGGFLSSMAMMAAERATRNRVSTVVVPDQEFRSKLRQRGFAESLIRVLPMGVDALQIFPLSENGRRRYRKLVGIPEESPLIVFTGRPHDRLTQDAAEMMVAMVRVRQKWPGAKLFLVGDGIPAEVLRRSADYESFTRIIGNLSELHGRLNSSAQVVVCSTADGNFPAGAAEAQASGTPVIALTGRRQAGTNETPDPLAKAIVLSRDQCAVPLAEQIETLLADPPKALAIGGEAREYILEHFELSSSMEALAALFRELAPEASWKATDSIPLTELEDIQRESSGAATPPRRPVA